MKKFTNLENTNKTVESSDNRHDFIKNLINESLTIENGEIKGKDVLSIAINKIIDINESKTKINVLENVKALTVHNLNFNTINESIQIEKNNIENIKSDKIQQIEEKVELINEAKKCKDCEDCKCDEPKEEKEERGEGDEDDDKIEEKPKKEKDLKEEKVAESFGNKVYITDSEYTNDIIDLAKLVESIKTTSDEEQKDEKKKFNLIKESTSIMSDEEWQNTYKPQLNHLKKVEDTAFNGWMYETYGEEAEYIKSMIDKKCVWGIDEGDKDGKDILYYIPITKWIDDLVGFFVTEVPHNGKDILVEEDVTPDK